MFRAHLSIVTVEPVEGGCRVVWVVHGQPGDWLTRWFARPVFRHVMSGGLRALARRFGSLPRALGARAPVRRPAAGAR